MDTPQIITTPDVHKFRLSHVTGPAHAKTGPTLGALAAERRKKSPHCGRKQGGCYHMGHGCRHAKKGASLTRPQIAFFGCTSSTPKLTKLVNLAVCQRLSPEGVGFRSDQARWQGLYPSLSDSLSSRELS
jgi:hypothetical protein